MRLEYDKPAVSGFEIWTRVVFSFGDGDDAVSSFLFIFLTAHATVVSLAEDELQKINHAPGCEYLYSRVHVHGASCCQGRKNDPGFRSLLPPLVLRKIVIFCFLISIIDFCFLISK